jgi:hypothetical protein
MTSTIQFAVPAASERRPGCVRNLLARTAAFVVLVTASTTLLALPYLGADQGAEGYAARLETAFQLAEEAAVRPSLQQALLVSAKKTDRLAMADCGAQVWPHIAVRCLETASRAAVRTVTVEYRLGESSSALVRLPVQHLASQ